MNNENGKTVFQYLEAKIFYERNEEYFKKFRSKDLMKELKLDGISKTFAEKDLHKGTETLQGFQRCIMSRPVTICYLYQQFYLSIL